MLIFTKAAESVAPKSGSKVKSITVKVCVTDCTGIIYITDMFLQGGSVATGWVGHASEIQWVLDG